VLVVETVSRSPGSGGFHGELVVRIPHANGSSVGRALDLLGKLYVFRKRIGEIASRFGPDVIVATWPSHEAVLLGGHLSRVLGVPLVVDIQDLSDYYRGLDPRGPLDSILEVVLYRRIYGVVAGAEKVITVTEPFKKILELRTGREDIELVYNGVDVDLYASAEITGEIPRGRGEVVGVFLGDLNWRYHMVDKVIYALSIMEKSSGSNGTKRLRLLVIGKGRYEKTYRAIAERLGLKNISFLGYLERPVLVKTLTSADFGIVGRPSIDNMWNIASVRTTIYEYMAAGLPIFAFGPHHSYIRYLVAKHRAGMYIASDDPKAISMGLSDFISTLEQYDRESIRRESRAYSWRELAKSFSSIVESARRGRG